MDAQVNARSDGAADRQARAVALLQQLIRLDTVNPPGRETTAQEPLAALLRRAGFEVELMGPDPERLNLVARLRGRADGPVLGLLSHVDTVAADPAGWRHGPWSGALADGCVWGRGALDMLSQTAAEVVAACSLAEQGWRPEAGDLVVISVADEELGGTGAEWVCAERPDAVRCDYLLNEGDGAVTAVGDDRFHGVCVAEKGVYRFRLTTHGVAGHASNPAIAENALLKLAPLIQRLGEGRPGWDVTPSARALLAGLGLAGDGDPAAELEALARRAPDLAPLVEPLLGVTFAPTVVSASDDQQINAIPAEARLLVDCRVPPGLGRDAVLARVRELIGEDGYALEFTETVTGNESPVDSPLMDALRRFVERADPGATTLPTVSPGYSDSRTFRDAFPECVAYGFFPHTSMSSAEVARLVHAIDERIPVADLGLAVECYRSVARELLGG
jgi:acetylornithine deacetylase/succinyl-diaminopimelate desuccinylase-like protein